MHFDGVEQPSTQVPRKTSQHQLLSKARHDTSLMQQPLWKQQHQCPRAHPEAETVILTLAAETMPNGGFEQQQLAQEPH